MIRVGIIGGGFVGSATALLASEKIQTVVFDIDPKRCVPSSTTFTDVCKTDVIFICVPTPITLPDGRCNTSMVANVIQQLRDYNYQGQVIVRSTVPVGFCESYGVMFMPEFLTERDWKNTFLNTNCWIFGIDNPTPNQTSLCENLIKYSNVPNKDFEIVSTKQAEYIKYVRNCFLALKVGFFNEVYHFAKAHGLNYNECIPLITVDPRIGQSHTQVPGHDGKFGFGGTCFPKDIASLVYQMNTMNVPAPILNAAQDRNNKIDRLD